MQVEASRTLLMVYSEANPERSIYLDHLVGQCTDINAKTHPQVKLIELC